jgi:hypothetical protein
MYEIVRGSTFAATSARRVASACACGFGAVNPTVPLPVLTPVPRITP